MPVRSVLYSKWSDVKQFISCKYIIIGTSICNYVLFIAPTKRVILAGKVRTRSALRESSRGLGYTPEGGINFGTQRRALERLKMENSSLIDMGEEELEQLLSPPRSVNPLEVLAEIAGRRGDVRDVRSVERVEGERRSQAGTDIGAVDVITTTRADGRRGRRHCPDEGLRPTSATPRGRDSHKSDPSGETAFVDDMRSWSPLRLSRSSDREANGRRRDRGSGKSRGTRYHRQKSSSSPERSDDERERSAEGARRQRDRDRKDHVTYARNEASESPKRGRSRNYATLAAGAKLGTYDGQTALETFLARFENCSDYLGWDETDRLYHLRASLTGPAGQLLWDAPVKTTVDRIIQLLRNRFGNVHQSERYRAELKTRKRKPNETLQSLYIDINRLVSLAYPGSTSALLEIVSRDAFLDAMDDPSMRVRILEREPLTLDAALSIACRLEAYDRCAGNSQMSAKTDADFVGIKPKYVKATSAEARSPNLPNVESELVRKLEAMQLALDRCQEAMRAQSAQLAAQGSEMSRLSQSVNEVKNKPFVSGGPLPFVQPDSVAPITDNSWFNRSDSGNSSQRLKNQKSGACFVCNEVGHYARDHRKPNSDRNVPPKQARRVKTTEANADVYLRARLHGKNISVLLDTGAEKNLCGSHLISDQRVSPTEQKLLAANGTAISLLGTAEIVIQVCGKEIKCNVFVSDAIDELILGATFLAEHNCVWNFRQSEISIDGRTAKLYRRPAHVNVTCRRIFAADQVEIPGRHIMEVPIIIARPTLRQKAAGWVIELNNLPSSLAASRALVDDDAVHVSIKLINWSDASVSLKRDAVLGSAEPVQQLIVNDIGPDAESPMARSNTSDFARVVYADEEHSIPYAEQLTPQETDVTECGRGAEVSSADENRPSTREPSVTLADYRESTLIDEVMKDAVHLQPIIDTLPRDLTDDQREKAIKLLLDHRDVFSRTSTDLGLTDLLTHHIDTGDAVPIKENLRRHPQAYLPIIDECVDDFLRRDLIEPCQSPWASNVVIIRKPGSDALRFCCDMRRVNFVTVKDAYALKRVDTCLESMGNSKYFCVLDSNSAYFQVALADEASKNRTAFVTRRGLYRFKVMNFGQCNSPATYSRLMDLVMTGLQYEMVLTFLDDLIVFANDFETCCSRLDIVLSRIKSAKLKLKPSKCKVFQPEVKFLGSIVSRDGIRPDPDKIKSIVNWPQPLNLTETRGFVALCSYYRRHIKGFAEIARPLYDLTKKGRCFEWGEPQEKAFQELKTKLTTSPVLASPIEGGKYVLDTDACSHSVAAILHQEQDGVLKVISYASRVLQPSETSYCSTKLELLAAVYGLKVYRHFLLCRSFILRTDNASLTYLMRTPEPLAQQSRWLNLISEYNFQIVHRAGVLNSAADALSRRPCEREEGSVPCTQCRSKSVRTVVSEAPHRTNVPFSGDESSILSPRETEVNGPVILVQLDGTTGSSAATAAGEGPYLDRPVELTRPPAGVDSLPLAENEPITDVEPRAPFRKVRVVEEQAVSVVGDENRPSAADVAAAAMESESIQLCSGVTIENLRQAQSRDAVITRIITLLSESETDSPLNWSMVNNDNAEVRALFAQRQTLEIRHGVLYRQFQLSDGTVRFYQAVIPRELQPTVLSHIHGSKLSGHFGFEKCRLKLRRIAYWSSWQSDLKVYVACCDKCNRYRRNAHSRNAPMKYATVTGPMSKIHIDLIGPFPRSYDGYVYALTVICSFTKYVITVPLRDKSAFSVARELVRKVYLQYSPSELTVHDGGGEFCNSLMRDINQLLEIQNCKVTPYRPKGNGQIERTHGTLNRLMAKMISANQKNWSDCLPYVTYAYNTTVHSSTAFSPFYLMFLREPRVSLDFVSDEPSVAESGSPDEYVALMKERMRAAYELVFEQLRAVFERAKRRYDPRVKFCRFAVGQKVWYFCPRKISHRSNKWSLQTSGPYEIMRKVNDVNYVIRLSLKHPSFTVHVDRLRQYLPPLTVAADKAHRWDDRIVVRRRRKPFTQRRSDVPFESRPLRNRQPPRRLIAE